MSRGTSLKEICDTPEDTWNLKNIQKQNTISLSCHEQVCLSG